MKIKFFSLICCSFLSGISLPLVAYTAESPSENVMMNQGVSNAVAHSLPASALRKLVWQPVDIRHKYTIILNHTSPQIHTGNIQGAVSALTLPVDQGTLEITLSSLIKNRQVYSPNVLVFDEKFHPIAFYSSHYFAYQQAGIISEERLEGTLKLEPALGQQKIYLLIYTTHTDLQTSTTMVDPAKAYAQGVGNAVPDIPDPTASHTDTGTLTLRVTSEQPSGSTSDNRILTAPKPKIVAKPISGETEQYFNDAIRKAIKKGDIHKALALLDEAERLGSPSARETFIKMIKSKTSE
ncbi:maltose operon protein MalM [Xenorhabdus innexi]|nr:maltose operon protein MalM [Xenorhabdus innexi]PHM35575.1 maltose operon protein MalM [Xenorhabdus innexi]